MRSRPAADSLLRQSTSRRRVLQGAALLAAGGLIGCQPASTPPTIQTGSAARPTAEPGQTARVSGRPDQPLELTMFVYSGLTERAYRDIFVPGFEAERGVKVTLDPGWWDMAPKLKVAPSDQPPFDLVMTDPVQGFPGIRDGLFSKIDLNRVPNARRFAPKVLESWIYHEGWGVPFISSAMTLAWNSELVSTPLKSWGDLFSEGLKGEIMLYNAFYMSLFTFAAGKASLDGKPGSARQMIETDLDGVLRFAREKRDWVKFWWPSTADAVQALLLKNVKAGNIHGNGLIRPLAEQRPIGLIVPPDDRAYVQLFFLVPKNTRSVSLAEDAINFIAGAEVQRALADRTGELSCNVPSVAAEVGAKNAIWARVYPHTAQDWESLSYYPYDAYDKQADKIVHVWNREILRKG